MPCGGLMAHKRPEPRFFANLLLRTWDCYSINNGLKWHRSQGGFVSNFEWSKLAAVVTPHLACTLGMFCGILNQTYVINSHSAFGQLCWFSGKCVFDPKVLRQLIQNTLLEGSTVWWDGIVNLHENATEFASKWMNRTHIVMYMMRDNWLTCEGFTSIIPLQIWWKLCHKYWSEPKLKYMRKMWLTVWKRGFHRMAVDPLSFDIFHLECDVWQLARLRRIYVYYSS